jgi:hypothetical protein
MIDTDEGAHVWLESIGLDKKSFPSLDPNKVKMYLFLVIIKKTAILDRLTRSCNMPSPIFRIKMVVKTVSILL